MKCRGMFIARSLSYEGAEFTIKRLPLSQEFRRQYDAAVSIFTQVLAVLNSVPRECPKSCKCPPCKALAAIMQQYWGQQVCSFL